MKQLKVFTAFSGYDSQCMALDRLGVDYDLVGWSEIDRYAIQAHNAVYPQFAERNFGDISKIDWSAVPTFDLFTYSFPCQDISNAGLQRGLSEGAGTRSSLLWECEKAIEAKRPKFLLMENVKALAGKKFLPDLHRWMRLLEGYGYTNFVQVLNAKDYGIPQNRERCFMVSILGTAWFNFPQPFKLDQRLRDVLESEVDERYYLSERILNNTFLKSKFFKPKTGDDIASTLMAHLGYAPTDNSILVPRSDIPKIICVGNTHPSGRGMNGNIFDSEGLCPTLTTNKGEGVKVLKDYRIRKLTERECFRLMGVSEENIDKIQSAGISRTQQYKMAGNSIVVDVLVEIFRNLLK